MWTNDRNFNYLCIANQVARSGSHCKVCYMRISSVSDEKLIHDVIQEADRVTSRQYDNESITNLISPIMSVFISWFCQNYLLNCKLKFIRSITNHFLALCHHLQHWIMFIIDFRNNTILYLTRIVYCALNSPRWLRPGKVEKFENYSILDNIVSFRWHIFNESTVGNQ